MDEPLIVGGGIAGTPDVRLVGGKAASLFELVAHGFEVPSFFVLTTAAFRAAEDGHLSPGLRASVREAWQALGGSSSSSFAVRSSSVAEDSADASFAGIFETVLGVVGEQALFA